MKTKFYIAALFLVTLCSCAEPKEDTDLPESVQTITQAPSVQAPGVQIEDSENSEKKEEKEPEIIEQNPNFEIDFTGKIVMDTEAFQEESYYRDELGLTLIRSGGWRIYDEEKSEICFCVGLIGDHDQIYYSKEVEGFGKVFIDDEIILPIAEDCKIFYYSKYQRLPENENIFCQGFITRDDFFELIKQDRRGYNPDYDHEALNTLWLYIENGEVVFIREQFES